MAHSVWANKGELIRPNEKVILIPKFFLKPDILDVILCYIINHKPG